MTPLERLKNLVESREQETPAPQKTQSTQTSAQQSPIDRLRSIVNNGVQSSANRSPVKDTSASTIPTPRRLPSGSDVVKSFVLGNSATKQDIERTNAEIEALREKRKGIVAQAETISSQPILNLPMDQQREVFAPARDLYTQAWDIDDQIAKLERQSDAYKYGVYLDYQANRYNDDFEELSGYKSTFQPGTEVFNAKSGTYTNTGYGDAWYDYINKDPEAIGRVNLRDINQNTAPLGLDNAERLEMTDGEIAIFNYLYAKDDAAGDKEHTNAWEYVNFLTSELNARERERIAENYRQYAREEPVAASAFSIFAAPVKGISYIGQLSDITDDGKIDQNAAYNKFSYINSAIRDEVSTAIESSGKWGKVGSFAYQTGMSMGDFLWTTAVAGGNSNLALAIMGTGAAADATIEAKDRGLSDGQAFALGTVAGVAEVFTEKVSLDKLLNADWEKGVLRYILSNAIAEGSEEGASTVINTVADILISKEKNAWRVSIDNYVAQGYSEKEAFGKSVADQAKSLGMDVLGGVLSGAAMSSGSGAIHAGALTNNGREINRANPTAGDIQALISIGLRSDPSTRAYQLAKSAQERINGGKELTAYEVGDLYDSAMRAESEAYDAQLQSYQGQVETVRHIVRPAENRIAQQTKKTAQQTAADRLTALGETGDIQTVAEAVAKTVSGETMTRAESKALRGSRYGVQVVNELSSERTRALQPANVAEAELTTDTLTPETYMRIVEAAQLPQETPTPPAVESVARTQNTQQTALQGASVPVVEAARTNNMKSTTPVAQTQALEYTGATYNAGTEASNNGGEVYLRDGGQRAGSANSGVTVSGVEEGTGRAPSRKGQGVARNAADQGAASLTLGEKVSPASFGILGGSKQKSVYLVKEGDTEFTREAKAIAAERGLELRLFAGDNLDVQIPDGKGGYKWASARAYIVGKYVFVRADHPQFTSAQLMRHEAGHDMINKGEINPNTVRERINETFTEEQVDAIVDIYEEAYRGSGYNADKIWVEIICDSLGDMNIFSGGLTESERQAQELLPDIKAAATQTQTEARTERGPPSGDEANFSIQEIIDSDGNSYGIGVYLDSDLLTGLTEEESKQMVRLFVVEELAGQSFVAYDGNNPVEISVADRSERFVNKSGKVVRATKDLATKNNGRKIKRESVVLADELIKASKIGKDTAAKYPHGWLDNYGKNPWGKRTVIVQDKTKTVWDATLQIANSEDGRKVLYDIDPIKKTGQAGKSATSTVSQMIPQSKQDVNGDFSLEPESVGEVNAGEAEELSDLQAAVRATVREELDRLGERYGWIKTGETPARDVSLPRKTERKKWVSWTARTVLEASATPDAVLPNIEELVANGDFSYYAYSDKEAIQDAETRIRYKGWASSLAEWMNDAKKGKVSKKNTALGWALYNNAVNEGHVETAMDILTFIVGNQRAAAQALQATRILKKLSPETQLYGVQRSIADLQDKLNERYGRNEAPELTVNGELAEKFLGAEDQGARDEVLKDIYRDIGHQMPSRFVDKWNAWRYLAMLGNPRTHVRNIVGNLGFAPVVALKDLTATGIEKIVYRLSGGKLARSKAAVLTNKEGRAILKAAWSDYENVMEDVSGGGKYSDFSNANKYVEEGRVIFQPGKVTKRIPGAKAVNKGLEAARKANSAALDAEDAWFSRPHYAYALAQYCKANGISPDTVSDGTDPSLAKAREYAILEAQKATYRDTNAFSQEIGELGRYRGENTVGKALSALMEGILPFRKTPANILVRGVEYSPLGLINGIKQAVWDVQKGTKTGAEAIDSISAGLTGTGLVALGIFLASQGLIRGHGGSDEDENEMEELMGHQAYSMELPNGTSITLDWLAPEALPFFVGVNLWEQTQGEDESVTFSSILSSIKYISEPMLEMSCLQSLNDVFDVVGYASSEGLDSLPSALASAATSYLTQALPTLLGQAERSGEDVRYTTYTEKNGFLTRDMQYTLGRASARIPGLDYQQIPYIDAWGRTEQTGNAGPRAFNNFVNPSYTSDIVESDMETELLRLYRATGESGVLPSRARKYFTVDKVRKDLTAEEYVQYATTKGQLSYELITELTQSDDYQNMSDEEKVKAVKDTYDFANETAKSTVSSSSSESWVSKAAKAEQLYHIDPETYITLRTKTAGIQSIKDRDGNAIPDSKGLQIMAVVYDTSGLTDPQRKAMFSYLGVGKSIQHYSKALVNEQLAKMRNQQN